LLARSQKQEKNFKNPDDDPRGPWSSSDYTCAKSKDERPNLYYPIHNPNTKQDVLPTTIRVWAFDRNSHERNVAENLLWWGKDGKNPVPRLKKFADKVREGTVPTTVWRHEDVGNNQAAKREVISFNGTDPFATPKPESLIQRVLEIATNPGDLVLDSFAGSGTTGAVAHKMGRRWIMVELGEHCHTHIVPRLQKVIDGQDPGGVTQATGWAGGGGFRYYELAPTLLSTDRWGNLVINPEYDPAMLSAAMCKLEGFAYAPSELLWWQQGRSSETDFIYVTTQTLGPEQLEALSHEVGADPHNPRSLLVCCGAYRGVTAAQAAQRWPNLTLKKIPKMVKDRCEWGHDDYSLNVANLPMAQKKVADTPAQDDMFGGDAA
jgi:adenine-specific DNA-methyltransferase